MHNFIFAIIFLSVTSVSALAHVPIRFIEGAVSVISNGDAIQVIDAHGIKVTVRLYGIDCPETEKRSSKTGHILRPGQPFGEDAFRALQGKLQFQRVRLDVMEIDRKGRTVSVAWIGDRNINREMIDEGWAWAYKHDLDSHHNAEYIKAEEQARTKRLGLWQQDNPQSPRKFRNIMRLKSWFSLPYL